jgi:hypothetical protein
MTKYIDPPWGFRYGFPKPIPENTPNIIEWLLQNGYPQSAIDEMGEYFVCNSFHRDEPQIPKPHQFDKHYHVECTPEQRTEIIKVAQELGRTVCEYSITSGLFSPNLCWSDEHGVIGTMDNQISYPNYPWLPFSEFLARLKGEWSEPLREEPKLKDSAFDWEKQIGIIAMADDMFGGSEREIYRSKVSLASSRLAIKPSETETSPCPFERMPKEKIQFLLLCIEKNFDTLIVDGATIYDYSMMVQTNTDLITYLATHNWQHYQPFPVDGNTSYGRMVEIICQRVLTTGKSQFSSEAIIPPKTPRS